MEIDIDFRIDNQIGADAAIGITAQCRMLGFSDGFQKSRKRIHKTKRIPIPVHIHETRLFLNIPHQIRNRESLCKPLFVIDPACKSDRLPANPGDFINVIQGIF